MLPTLNARGDVVLLAPGPVRRRDIAVGDVVVARSPVNPRHVVCKRVLGLPGGAVDPGAMPGVPHARSSHGSSAAASIPIPPGHVWLQGDNAANSTDSRAYGPVPYALLRGRVVARVWPLTQAGRIDSEGEGGKSSMRAWARQAYRPPRPGGGGGGGDGGQHRPRY
jgi:mitochondrial inner membrane protease subunit 1